MLASRQYELSNTVAVAHVKQIIRGAKKQGHDTYRILKAAGISPALLRSPKSRVTITQCAQLIRTLQHITNDELWGLTSHSLPLGSFAHICHTMVSCSTLEEALRAGLRVFRLLLPSFRPRLIIIGNTARIQVPYPLKTDPATDYAIRTFCFFSYGLMSWLVARPIPVISFSYPKTQAHNHSEAGALLKTQVLHHENSATIEMESRWLTLPITQTKSSTVDFLKSTPANLLIRYKNNSSSTERVRHILKKNHNKNMYNLDDVSALLGVSSPTLRRHLQAEGSSFQIIKDAVRRDLAIFYLQNPCLSINDIAIHLGFSEPSTFHRAFKTWTGMSPGFYRNQL